MEASKPHSEHFSVVEEFIIQGGYEIVRMSDGHQSAVPMSTEKALAALRGIEEQLEATREALRGVFVWVEVPDSSMGDADWRKREDAMREAQRILTSYPAKERS